MQKEEIGKIKSFSLGKDDHDIFTMGLDIKFRGCGQGFGHLCLDTPIKKNGKFIKREGTAYGMNFIMKVMEVFDVRDIQELVGQRVTVIRDGVSLSSRIIGIKTVPPDEERSFFPAIDLKKYIPKENKKSICQKTKKQTKNRKK